MDGAKPGPMPNLLAAEQEMDGEPEETPPTIGELVTQLNLFSKVQDVRFEIMAKDQSESKTQLKNMLLALNLLLTKQSPPPPDSPGLPIPVVPGNGALRPLMLPMALTPLPARFGGDPQDYLAFKLRCQLHFNARPDLLNTDEKKVNFIVLLLDGNAFKWVTPLIQRGDPILKNLSLFVQQMDMVFERQFHLQARRQEFLCLKQGARGVLAYLTEFQTHAAEEGWPESCQVGLFHKGLTEELKDALMMVDPLPEDMNAYIRLALRLEHRLAERGSRRGAWTPAVCPTPGKADTPVNPSIEESMEVGAVRSAMSPKERERRQKGRCCYFCGKKGHFIKECPSRTPSGNAPAAHVGGK